MDEDFYRLIGIAIRNSKSNSIADINEFVRKSENTRRIILKMYQENPDITKEQINQQMQDILEEILSQTVEFKDLRSYLIRRNIINYLRLHPEEIERQYNMIKQEEKKGQKVNSPENIIYSANINRAIRQMVINAIANIRNLQENIGEIRIKQINQLTPQEKRKFKQTILESIKDKTDREESLQAISVIMQKNELERVKYYILNVLGVEKADKEIKNEYIEMLIQIGNILRKFDLLPQYVLDNNKQVTNLRLPEILKVQDEDDNNLFGREKLEPLSVSKLTGLYSFWLNRLVKEIIDIYTSYFMMYQLNLDDKQHVKDGFSKQEASTELLEKLNVKISFLYLKLNELYKKIREEHKQGGRYDVTKQVEEISRQNSEQYQSYFSTIGGLSQCTNDFEEDFLLCFNLENIVKNFYAKKDEVIMGLLYSLYDGNISENWGIIEEKDPEANFALIGVDIEGLNMPLRLHIHKKVLKNFLEERQQGFMVPLYKGYEDFKINGRRISTKIMMPLTDKQQKEIEEVSSRTSEDDNMYKFLKHLSFLSNGLNYPEHLKRKKTVIKKGKKKIKTERIETYVDIKTGKKYIKQNGQIVEFEDDGR